MKAMKALAAVALFTAAAVALPISAQIATADDHAMTTKFLDAQTADQYLAKDHLIGAKVKGKNGKIVGDIEDLIIDGTNTVVGVVLGTGGFLGFSEKKIGIDLTSLTFGEEDGKLTVTLPDVTEATLKDAAAFKRAQPPKSLFQRATEKMQELTDKTTATTKDAIEKAKPMLETATEKTKEAYEKTKEAVAPAVEKAGDAISSAVDSAKKAVSPDAAPEAPATDAP